MSKSREFLKSKLDWYRAIEANPDLIKDSKGMPYEKVLKIRNTWIEWCVDYVDCKTDDPPTFAGLGRHFGISRRFATLIVRYEKRDIMRALDYAYLSRNRIIV